MVQITKIKTDEGVLDYAWIQTAKSLEEGKSKFVELYDYEPKDAFKMFPGVVCGPLDVNRDYGGHA